MHLRLGYSPCPNDTFIFHALAHDVVRDADLRATPAGDPAPDAPPDSIAFDILLDDVDALNGAAERGELDIAKVSYHAYLARLTERYVMLPAGGALGRGVGPLIVTRDALPSLGGRRVAIPGGLTTATLLLRLSQPSDIELVVLRYDAIMPAVAAGDVDAGLIIHESRFTYPEHGLRCFADLGAWWETETGALVPLGGIVARRDLGAALLRRLNDLLRTSLAHAWQDPTAPAAYVARHAQEMDPTVRRRHIDLYVNGYSMDVGRDGRAAVDELVRRGVARDLFVEPVRPLFADAGA